MALSKPACVKTVSAEFCLGDPDFCSCEMCGDKCPEYKLSLFFELLEMCRIV